MYRYALRRVCIITGIILAGTCYSAADYWDDRTQFFSEERSLFLGSQIQLTPQEEIVNGILMEAKGREYSDAFVSVNTTFPPARHFFEAKGDVERSEVFKMIQVMPKGGALHGHDMALASTEYLLMNLTYRDNLYACIDAEDRVALHFFQTPDASCAANWTLVSDLRRLSGDVDAFDTWLGSKLTLFVENPQEVYDDLNKVWSKFQNIFGAIVGLVNYKPAFEDYFYQVLTEFYEDNVMYLEVRTVLANVYDLDGTIADVVETASAYNDVVQRFKEDNPGFYDCKIIYAPSRKVDNATLTIYLDNYRALKSALPDFVVGFDLVGQEDLGEPISAFVDVLLEFLRDGTHFFFHAGETNWQGTTDLNLIDAILLNTTRIGHGFALNKHPLALKMIKERGIAVEVNPISNQVLMLVSDLRNHPAAMLMADNYPLVIGSDDPSFWGAKGLSYDMYAAFMGLGGLHADLRTLKQLAINSLQYSGLPASQKQEAMTQWENEWNSSMTAVIERDIRNRNKINKPSPVRSASYVDSNAIRVTMVRRGV